MPRCAEAMPPSFVLGQHAVACWPSNMLDIDTSLDLADKIIRP